MKLQISPEKLGVNPNSTGTPGIGEGARAWNRSEPVHVGSVRFFAVRQPLETGLGLGLLKYRRKTGPDRTSKHYLEEY